MTINDAAIRQAIADLLHERAPGKTACPSEVARAVARGVGEAGAWRDAMPAVHAVVDQLVAARVLKLSWRGRPLPGRDGPYRISLDDAGQPSAADPS